MDGKRKPYDSQICKIGPSKKIKLAKAKPNKMKVRRLSRTGAVYV